MPYILVIEGQEIPLAEEVAASDETVRNAMLPFYPEAASAEIKREQVDGTTQIRMIKKAGTKGSSKIVQRLACSDQCLNPALALTWQIKQLEIAESLCFEKLLALQADINQAISVGEDWEKSVRSSLRCLAESKSHPSTALISGF